MKTFEEAAKRIYELTKFSRKDEGEVMLSYLEELGELCQEVKIALKVAGTEHKKPGPDGIFGECADVWICAVSYGCAVYDTDRYFYLNDSIISLDVFKNYNCVNRNPFDMQKIVFGVALGINPNPEIFLNKIHEKLDKWERNVKFRQAVDTVFEEDKELLKRLAQ